MDQPRLLWSDDALANVLGGDQYFDRGHATGAVSLAHQALADDGFEHGCHLQANLLLLGWREDGDDAVNGLHRVQSVKGRENQVAGFSGVQRGANGFQVAHFAHQDGVRILAQAGAQGGAEGSGIHLNFALVDESFLIAVQELDGVFDGDDVFRPLGVDAVNHGGQGRGLAGTGYAGHQHQSAAFFADLLDDFGQIEFVEGANLGGDHAQHHAYVAPLLKYGNA